MANNNQPGSENLDLMVTRIGLAQDLVVFGRFRLKRVLGRGGMGVVWLAWDQKASRDVAMKFMPDIVSANATALQDMRRETRNGIKLSHQNVVTMYDLVEENESAAIIMEYVKGTNLDIMRRNQPSQVFEVAALDAYVHQLLDALEYAHQVAEMVHCDLKPANLMVDEHDVLKVADFGIARNLHETVSRISAKFNGAGSLAYMSPQQMLGDKPTAADDLYAFGSTLYELLTGKPPFYIGDLATQIETRIPPLLNERLKEFNVYGAAPIPQSWETVVAACLEKRREDRPANIEAIRQGLQGKKFIRASGQTAILTRPTLSPRKDTAAGTGGGLTMTRLAIAAAVVVGAGGFLFGGREKKNLKPAGESTAVIAAEDENLKTARENVEAFKKVSADDFASAWEYRVTWTEVRKKIQGMAQPGNPAWSELLSEVKRLEALAEAAEARERSAYQTSLKLLQERHQASSAEAVRADLNATAKMKIWQDFLATMEDQEFNPDYGHGHENLRDQATVEFNKLQIQASTVAAASLASGAAVVISDAMKDWNAGEKEVVIQRVQKALQSAGYYAGSVDGKHGLKLHQALLAYQEKERMPGTARIDDNILNRLQVDTSRPPQQVVISRPSGGGTSGSRPAASSQQSGVPEQIMRWSGAMGAIGNARSAWRP